MSDQSQPRELPEHPSLRYLKIEAKRRLADGEFATLHDAQLAIAREHGLPSWTALKEHIAAATPTGSTEPARQGPALGQLRWLAARFAGADRAADWWPPTDDELAGHLHEKTFRLLRSGITSVRLRKLSEEITVDIDTPRIAHAISAGLRIEVAVEPEPPHRIIRLRVFPTKDAIADDRTAAPSSSGLGEVPGPAAELAQTVFGEYGLVALAFAGKEGEGRPPWALSTGWADLERDEILTTDHRFPVYQVATLVTATTVLRLVADRRIGLDDAANDHLRTVRLADDAVTIRDLLTRTGGVDDPAELLAETVPDLLTLYGGPVLPCGGQRATLTRGVGGYATLGQLIADVTEVPYPDAAVDLVTGPLGMTSALFPTSWPGDVPADADPNPAVQTITGYFVQEDGSLKPIPKMISTVPAAAGLWASPADIVRFAAGWSSLLPAELAAEARRPQAGREDAQVRTGFAWSVSEARGIVGIAGIGPAGGVSLVMRSDGSRVKVVMTSRGIDMEPINGRLVRAIAAAVPRERGESGQPT